MAELKQSGFPGGEALLRGDKSSAAEFLCLCSWGEGAARGVPALESPCVSHTSLSAISMALGHLVLLKIGPKG